MDYALYSDFYLGKLVPGNVAVPSKAASCLNSVITSATSGNKIGNRLLGQTFISFERGKTYSPESMAVREWNKYVLP